MNDIDQIKSIIDELISGGFWFIVVSLLSTITYKYITVFIQALRFKKSNVINIDSIVQIDGIEGKVINIGWSYIKLLQEDSIVHIPIAKLDERIIIIRDKQTTVSVEEVEKLQKEINKLKKK